MKLWAKGVVEKNTVFEGSENTQYYIRKAGQLMYGKLDFLNCAFGIVPPELDGYESTLDAPAFDISNIDSTFLLNKIIQRNFYKKNGDIANGSRKAKRIHPDSFLEMEIAFPELREQTKIAGFITCLNTRIEKQRRLVELLKSYKRGVIEHYFSKQITLTSSGEIWRKCLIKDCLYYEQPQKYIVKSEQYSNSYPIPVLTANKAFILGYTNEIDGIYDKGQVIIYDDFTMETKFVEFPFKVKSSTIKMLTPKNGSNLYFLFCLLQHLRLKPEGHQRSYISIVETMDVSIPSVNEQNYTAELFYTLNRLVECEEDNLTHFEKEKASLLQQMFI